MRLSQSVLLATLSRVQRFLDANSTSLGAINQSPERATLDDIVKTLSAPPLTRRTAKRLSAIQAGKEQSLRESLKRNHMRPIATVAAVGLRQAAEFGALQMPPFNCTSRVLIDLAGSMGSAAANHISTFVDAGLPADFLTSLAKAIGALTEAISSRNVPRWGPRGATRLAALTPPALQVLDELDPLVVRMIADSDLLLIQWRAAKLFAGDAPALKSRSDTAAISTAPSAASPVDAGLAVTSAP